MEKTLTFDDWIEKFNPIKNQFLDYESDSFDGYAFDYTKEEELNFIKSQNPNNIWTLVWAEDCYAVIPGVRWVNRESYLITEKPFTDEELTKEYLVI